jgi:hypothetical protein
MCYITIVKSYIIYRFRNKSDCSKGKFFNPAYRQAGGQNGFTRAGFAIVF